MDATAGDELAFVESRPMGAAYVLDGAWRRLGIDKTLVTLLKGRKLDARAERVLFALVANRAIDPSSKLAATTWAAQRVAIDGLDSLDSDACYRAMDWLLEIEPELAEAVYWSVADLLNLEVDVLFFDTTSTYLLRDRTSRRPHRRRDGGVPDLRALQGSPALLRTSDPTLSAEDIALGYKQLLEVERGWRDMKSTLELRRRPPARTPHPRPRAPVLARPVVDPRRQNNLR